MIPARRLLLGLALLTALPWAATDTLSDLTGAVDLFRADFHGYGLAPSEDSVRYRRLLQSDTLLSGTYSTTVNKQQSAWPTVVSRGANEFVFSYILFREYTAGLGNFLLEKRFRLTPARDSIGFFCLPDNQKAHRDSLGTALSRHIMLNTGFPAPKIGGVNTKSLASPDGRIFRLCQGYGGNDSSLYILDTIEGGGQSWQTAFEPNITDKSFPDYCLNSRGDTLFAAYTPNREDLKILPVRLMGANQTQRAPPVTLRSDGAGRRDIGIARDSASGKFLVVCCKNDSLLEAVSVDADLSNPVAAVLRNRMPLISDASRNLRVVSVGHSRFAVAYFLGVNGSGGVRLLFVDIAAGISAVDSAVLETGRGLIPALSFSYDRLAALWLRDPNLLNDNSAQVYAKVFSVRNGALRDTFYSGPFSAYAQIPENFFSSPGNFTLAAAIDTLGNLFGGYARTDYRLYGNAWSPTFFYADTGYATLRDTLRGGAWGDLNRDSLTFSNFGATIAGGGGVDLWFSQDTVSPSTRAQAALTPSLVVGPVTGSRLEWRARLWSANLGQDRPVLNRLYYEFNVKPRRPVIDSVRINGGGIQIPGVNDTLSLFARSDTLKIHASVRDFDNASALTAHWGGLSTRDETFPRTAAHTYARQSDFGPVNHADTLYRLTLSATDTNGWGSDTAVRFFRLRNPAPALTLTSTTFLFSDSTADTIRNNDTLRFFRRHRTVLRALATDSNDAGALTLEIRVNGAVHRSRTGSLSLADTLFSDDVPAGNAACRVRVLDPGGKGDSLSFTLLTRNDPPRDSLFFMSRSLSGGALLDTVLRRGDTLPVADSGFFVLSALGRDSNDAALDHLLLFNGAPWDSALNRLDFLDTLSADSVDALDTIALMVRDSFTTDTFTFYVRVAHPPRIISLLHRPSGTLLPGDSINLPIRLILADTFTVTVNDVDVTVDDTLAFRLIRDGVTDTLCRGSFLTADLIRHAGRPGGRLVLQVTDRSGMKDSFVVFTKYAQFERTADLLTDSLWLADSILLYPSRSAKPSPVSIAERAIRFRNTGTESLSIRSAIPVSDTGAVRWIGLGVSANRALFPTYTADLRTPRAVLPGESLFLFFRATVALPVFDSAGLTLTAVNGDTIIGDTLVIATSDPDQDTLRFPVRITVAEPPFLVCDSLLFLGDVPALPRAAAVYVPHNAPYRKIAMVWSEALNPADLTARNLTVYSVLDSLRFGADSATPIPGRYHVARSAGCRFDTVFFTPLCASNAYTSPHFQAAPPDSFFIASDRLRVKIASRVRDLTGNRADLTGDFKPDPLAFKILSAAVDSASLSVESLDPPAGGEASGSRPIITVVFSAPLDSAAVDTALVANRSVRVFSSFVNGLVPLEAPPAVSGRTLIFRPAANFFSGESVAVLLSSSIRDLYRNTLDGNRDGAGAFFLTHGGASYAQVNTFEAAAPAARDNFAWSFRTARQDFYFFPCPYEPGRDARHAAQGGIVFKNLHALTRDNAIAALNIRIMDVAGDPVYSSRKHGVVLPCRLQGASPVWKWDSRNDAGRDVASGVYLFALSDSKDAKILHRGKLIVIR